MNNNSTTFTINFAEDSARDISRALREQKNHRIFEAHERVRQQQREQRRSRRPRTGGSTRLSNTDTVARASQIRGQLLSKLNEIMASDMEPRARKALATDIQMQIDRVDQQIAAIRRRLRAIEAERSTRRSEDTPEARRRRWRDMQERHINIRRELLYHADEGGLNPNTPLPFSAGQSDNSPISFDIGGNVGTMDMPMVLDSGGASLEFSL